MIRVTIELVLPLRPPKELGRIEIENVSHTAGEFDDYHIKAAVERHTGDATLINRTLTDYPRRRFNVLGLLYRALAEIGPEPMKEHSDFQPHHARGIGERSGPVDPLVLLGEEADQGGGD